jgi:hypothetical protein
MPNFRVYYIDAWKEEKTITLEGDNEFEVNNKAERMFGKSKVIKVECLDPIAPKTKEDKPVGLYGMFNFGNDDLDGGD